MTGALVVNADDLGVSRGATLGVLRAHREGIVTSASIAPSSEHYGHALTEVVRACPALGVGLHFTLTSGRPASPASRVPRLVGRDGYFRHRFLSLWAELAAGRSAPLLDEIELELEAQLDRLKADGVACDHIDGERHVQLLPGVFERVVAAAARRKIPFVRAGRELSSPDAPPAPLAGRVKERLLSYLTARARPLLGSVRSADHLASYRYTGRLDRLLPSLLAGPALEGVVEVMVHPGVPAESAGASLGNEPLERYLVSDDRRAELEACVAARPVPSRWNPTTFGALARGRS